MTKDAGYNSPERVAFRRGVIRGVLWSFFKPIVIGWGAFAVIAAVLYALIK